MAKQQYVLVNGVWTLASVFGKKAYVQKDDEWIEVASIGAAGLAEAVGTGHVIQDEGADLPQREALNFVGTGVVATDSAEGTKVTINASPSYAPSPAGQPDGKHLEVKTGAYVFVNRAIVYASSPPASPADGDVWIERSI